MAGEQTKFTTSFIPKKPVTSTVSGQRTRSSFMTIVAMAIFLGTVGFGVGIFVYKMEIERQIESQLENLRKARGEFDENFVREATRLNTRINAVKTLLDNHQAPSAVFALLERHTLATIRFNNLKYSKDVAKNAITLEAGGMGLGYQSIVLQSDEFGKTGTLRDVVFSSVQPTPEGLVTFSLKTQIDQSVVLYRKNLSPALNGENPPEVSFNHNQR